MGTPETLAKQSSQEKADYQNDRDIDGESGSNAVPLAKNFNMLSLLAACVSLMATWEAFCSTMATGLISGGPVSLVYGYIVAIIGTMATGLSLSEAASMFPSAGGQYHFVAKLAPRRFALGLSWTAGWITTFGWFSVAASAPFLAGTMIQGLIILNYPDYQPERWHGTLLYWAVLVVALVANTVGIRALPMIGNITMALHVILFFVLLITIVVASPTKHSASFVFTQLENNSGWESDGIAWCIGLLSSAYVLVGYDGATHLSEEMERPKIDVPRAMIGSLIINGILGFALIIALLFCMGDISSALETGTGFPIIEIFHFITRSNVRATSAMVSAIIIMASLSTLPLVGSAARTLWALARDKAVPFSATLSKVDEKRQIPIISIVVTTVLLALFGLLNIASTSAFNAIVSLSVLGLYISYLLAVMMMLYQRLTKGHDEIQYGPFKLGKFGLPLNVISTLYTTFTCIFMLFPPYRPVTALNMNYAPVVLGGVLLFSGIYWVLEGRKTYEGPMMEEEIIGRSLSNRSK